MPTSHIVKSQKAVLARPGTKSGRARKYANWTIIGFLALAGAGTAMLFAEIATPGMAWYEYP